MTDIEQAPELWPAKANEAKQPPSSRIYYAATLPLPRALSLRGMNTSTIIFGNLAGNAYHYINCSKLLDASPKHKAVFEVILDRSPAIAKFYADDEYERLVTYLKTLRISQKSR